MVSPRKSRRKSACFSRTTTSTPARASRNPSIMPAGPPPAMQQRASSFLVARAGMSWFSSRAATDHGANRAPPAGLLSDADADLVEVRQQVGGVLVDAVGAGPLQFVLAVAAREQADPQGPRPPGRQQVPDAVAHH